MTARTPRAKRIEPPERARRRIERAVSVRPVRSNTFPTNEVACTMTNDEIVDAYAEGFRNADAETIRRLVAPRAVIWHNFDQRDRDIVASLGELERMRELFSEMRMEVIERFALDDGIGVRLVLRGTLRQDGQAFASHQAKFFRVRDGKIIRIEEYVAPPEGMGR
jgi:ketosteroid isomerase-like protein